ncbi:hypothetical protein FHU10_4844 [Serratia fonticola]|jgi:hypothetical protein|uniref:Uncharacterized protein n=1 Tax=Serratia fonticola TaxID=47917 RepID=A0A542BP19_SERFO|nr:hypothetical protein [Serratia fonticola]TQI80295.1 hypothetical protein FHU09_2859 [Serratia fonticola]TQI97678.1 hypothetical protein FHU11_3184 [Serratia fonticola]TVZ72176.1 hypothetical protein FHU10_4844 [Serratia fonticola]
MKFSEQEIKPVWDEVARLIGDSVMQLRHRGEVLSVDSLTRQLAQQLTENHDIERRILITTAISMLKNGK